MSIEDQFKAIPPEILHKLIKDLNEYYGLNYPAISLISLVNSSIIINK